MGPHEPGNADAESERHADWPRQLEWIERQAQDSLKARFATCEFIAKEAQTTLTVVLAGAGGTAAYAARIFEPGPAGPIAIAATATCAYLVGLAAFIVLRCMMFQSYPALYQDPENLIHPGYSLNDVREAELKNIGERIAEAKAINDTRALRLNRVRLFAALSPLVFLVAAILPPAKNSLPAEASSISCNVGSAASSGASVTIKCQSR